MLLVLSEVAYDTLEYSQLFVCLGICFLGYRIEVCFQIDLIKGAKEGLSREEDEDLKFPEKRTFFETCFFRFFLFLSELS